jgi:teichuronic acid biosynthesis glycosyltransferase TuaC
VKIIYGHPRPDVLFVTNMWPHDQNRRYGIFVRRQIESLRSLGLECEVIFIEGYRTRWDYIRAALYMLRLNWAQNRPSLVHGHGGETALVVRWYVRAPVVVSYCGDDLLGTARSDGSLIFASRVRSFILRQQARLMTATVTKSSSMERALPPTVRGRNEVVPNGVDRLLFRPRPRDDVRDEMGWMHAERIVLFGADPAILRKRYWLAEAACSQTQRMIGPITLKVAAGIPPDEMPRVMTGADCLLLTSSHEGSPNVVKEATACGLPVVSTDVGDVRQVLNGVDPSWVCEPHVDALAIALAQCLTER